MKAIALVEARNHVCCRYRVLAFEEALANSGWSLAIEPLATGWIRRLLQFRRVEAYDAVFLQRKLLPGWQLHELRRRSKRLIFDFDDAVLYRDSYDLRGPHHKRRSDRFQRTVRVADAIIAGNPFLADRARTEGADPLKVRVIPTCIETRQIKPSGPFSDSPGLTLVWIGSSSTMAGLALQRPLWERIGREFPDIRLRMVCDQFLDLAPLTVEPMLWSEATEAADVASADVGISWIPDDLWSRGKCGLKVLQYQAAGLPVVANPVGVHQAMIRPGIDGFLPASAEEWVESIRVLAEDQDQRHRMGQAARESLEANYSVQAWAPAFVAAISESRRPAGPGPRAARKSGEVIPSQSPPRNLL